MLLDKGADPDLQSSAGLTPLMIASQNGNTKIANHLLDKGADPDLQRSNGITALMVASMNGQTDIVSVLLNRAQILF